MDARPPSVDALARSVADVGLPHPLLVDAARDAATAGDPASVHERARRRARGLLQPVVNATGVLLHTNLGRAPLSHRQEAGAWNLELDLETGRRGSRRSHAASLVARAVGAEDALVVNNGAGAVLLALAVVAGGRPVTVSRGELVEIGGGFRVPEVCALSGAPMIEVGTTNRTRRADYEAVLASTPDVGAILKVHRSNFRIEGFTEAVGVRELAELGPPLVVDLGSGLLDARTPWLDGPPPSWLAGEPAALQTLEEGAALVTFSGDKLLGGPQAGVIAGRADLVAACARHPLARALRPGALVLAALQHTMLAYLRRDGQAIPFWRMATVPVDELRARARALAEAVTAAVAEQAVTASPPGNGPPGNGPPGTGPQGADAPPGPADGPRTVEVVDCSAVPGAGSVPGLLIPSAGVAVPGDVRLRLRRWDPPVVARMEAGRTLCDLRSVEVSADATLAAALAAALAGGPGAGSVAGDGRR